MRKPCYRIWNVKLNRMEYSDDWSNIGEFIDTYYSKKHQQDGNKIMQYIGMNDKTDKKRKIYEGDIVYCADKSRHLAHFIDERQVYFKAKIIFRNNCFTFERLEYPDNKLGIGQFSIDPLNLFGEESLNKYDLEVLGNEFENHELLEVNC